MSTSHIKPAGRKTPRNRVVATHKYSVGASVLHSVSERAGKTSFAITRQMPDAGAGFQYRIKCDRDGQERVVAEETLERFQSEPVIPPRSPWNTSQADQQAEGGR
jgi:hypothetical protein